MMEKGQDWNIQVKARVASYFCRSSRAADYYGALWEEHLAAELASHHFVAELTGPSDQKFRQRLWEMALGRHLRACGHAITLQWEGEPDFRFMVGGTTVWVEAISPSPGADLPLHWTTYNSVHCEPPDANVPNREMLLRWTSAFKEKAEKCALYRAKGVVGSPDAFVIAIDGSQLCKFPNTTGISQRPFVVEAVFGVGPLACEIDGATGRLGPAFQSVELAMENRNRASVFKDPFLRPEFSGISAVLGCYSTVCDAALLPMQVAFNPLAQVPIASGVLGSTAEEWVAELESQDAEGQDWSLWRR